MKNFLLFSLLIAFLISCNSVSEEVQLNYTNLEGSISKTGNFSFDFNTDLVPDSLVGSWVQTEYISFNPLIDGEFKWISSKELVFSPFQPLDPATEYIATFTNKILNHKENKKIAIPNIHFETYALGVDKVNTFWSKNQSNIDQVKLRIQFTEDINHQDINAYISIKNDRKEVQRKLLQARTSDIMEFILPEIQKNDDDLALDITLKKGIKPLGGSQGRKTAINKTSILITPFNLIVRSLEVEHNGTKGILKVVASQEIDKRDLKKFIEITPKITFEVKNNPNGFTISSDKFLANEKYAIKLKKGIKGKVGGKLKSDYTKDITFGQLQPQITFQKDKSFYLSANGERNIETKIINVETVKVIISKVYENNLITSRASNTWHNTKESYYDDYYYDDYYYGSSSQQTKDIVFEKTYHSKDLKTKGSIKLLNLEIKEKLKDYKGIYHINIQSEKDRWINDNRFISISDFGLIAKRGKESVSVFINSLSTAQSITNAKVKIYGLNNQIAGEGVSNADGYVKINIVNQDISGFTPALITVSKGEDFNVLMLKDSRVNTADFDIGGIRNPHNGMQTFIYPERNLYRPGEKVHFATIVRKADWFSPGEIPLKIEIRTPNGKLLKSIKKTLNEEGSFEAEFDTEKTYGTGNYNINVYTSNDIFLASKAIKLEEFMPDRIKIEAEFDKENYNTGEEATLEIHAQNLFGTAATNRNYEIELSYRRKVIYPKEFKNYNFNIAKIDNDFEKIVRTGKTDEKGKVSESFEIPKHYENMGNLNATVYSTVFDETNRPVNRKNLLNISTQSTYFGIGYFDYYFGNNTQIDIPVIAIDRNEKTVNEKAKVVIIKHEYKTVLNKSGSYYRYKSQPYEKIVFDKEISIQGKGTVSYKPTLSGRYEVRVSPIGAEKSYVSQSFYSYSWGGTSFSSFEVNNEGKIDIETSKEEYEAGEEATILLKTPFDGKLLITVEREKILEHFYLNTKNRAAEFSFNTSNNLIPNAYITATLFKSHQETDFPLTVAHGFKSIQVMKRDREMKVDIESVENTRSKTKQTFKVKTTANSKVSIAVVDEGILQVSGFKTPSPYDYFYQKRALLVQSHDMYPYLFKEVSADNSGAGGEDFELGKRVNPMQNDRVKLVSFWSGILETNGRGETSFEVDIPQFSGSLRVMAIAHKGNSFGSNEKNVIVVDPIILSSSIPRFFSPGDTGIITTTLTNTTKENTNSKNTITVSGPLQIIGESKKSIAINSKEEQQFTYKIFAKNEIGQGKITVSSNALGEVFKEEIDISIRPATSLLKETGTGRIAAGTSKVLDLNQEDFIKSSTDYKVLIGRNPMIEFSRDLDYLVKYPYGCSEQTISAVFPQLYLDDIYETLYHENDQKNNIKQNINVAISKLRMRQGYNGGIGMWQSASMYNWWITAYATHFALEAKKAGYNIGQDFIQNMIVNLKNRLKSKETQYYYYNNGSKRLIAPKEVAYSLYVLSLAGEPDVSLMNYYKSNIELFSSDSRYLLAASFAISGEKNKALELIPSAYANESSDKQFGGNFYSSIRDEAMALNALIDINPQHSQIGNMAMHVSKNLKSNYLNTQERIFSLMALGKIAKQTKDNVVSVTVNSGGKKIDTYYEGLSSYSTKDIKDGKIEFEVKGNGDLYYFWESEGISKTGKYKQEDNYLRVRKTFFDKYGNTIYGNRFKVNDLVIVQIAVDSDYNKKIENVAITDILPACFEIENPRTDEIPGTEWIKKQTKPDYLDLRDDRINIFDDVHIRNHNQESQKYYYVVRVVSKGVFNMGPVAADAMYNAEYHSYHGAGKIIVE